MKKKLLFMMLLTSFAFANQATRIKQGISGTILLKTGNAMPSPGRPVSNGTPVARNIFIYELTRRTDAIANGTLYNHIKTKLIAKTKSDTTGRYAVALPTGKYSVFVETEGGLFANLLDDKGNINMVEVKKDSVSKCNIVINNLAFY
ncbi:carboxypeptidase regulatory-like domain-containing protein [Mucilaginibacter sp. PPCGB 2223]|uniref:carboxypeptidase regulatory-like domain-containing protein n=1 Tax=Mucilaginibacter sp. PPCGB 2223 TaxID=1886027 RepID=UPI00111237D6|nr:carboxypeptidase regulatory-like domain-containing protein [Mucilaginibacter sp. PPCGB 2223]